MHRGSARKVAQAQQEKEMGVPAIDRHITGTCHVMQFFGRPAAIPLGPAALSLRLGTPLLPVCVYGLQDDTYTAEAAPPMIAQATHDAKADADGVTQTLLSHIEGF